MEAYGAFEFVERVPSIAACAASDGAGARAAVATQPSPRPTMMMMSSTSLGPFMPSVAVAQAVVRRIRKVREREKFNGRFIRLVTSADICCDYVYVYYSEVHSSLA